MNSKLVILCVCIFSVFYTVKGFDAETQKKIKELIFEQAQICVGSHKPTAQDIKDLRNHKVPDTNTAACFLKCILTEFGVIVNGKYSKKGALDAAIPFITSDEKMKVVEGVIDKCAAEIDHDKDECQLARDAVLCGQKYKDELGIDMMDIEF